VAANQAYRTGNLDSARQLTDQAAALDPSRAELWQQHREQIAARSLILDAQAAYADGGHQRTQDLLGQARQIDPRMPAIWDGDLPGMPARMAHPSREHETAPGPDNPADSSRTVVQGTSTRQQVRAAAAPASQKPPWPSWPGSPARGQPGIPNPGSAEQTSAQTSSQCDPAAVPRQPGPQAGIVAGDTQPDAEPADDDPSTRWPAPNPRVTRETSPPGRQGAQVVAASRATRPPERADIAAHAEAGDTTNAGGPADPPDWRDQLLADARRSWQPAAGQPRDPSASVPPERQASRPGIEPDT
jgi:hypothetical protein